MLPLASTLELLSRVELFAGLEPRELHALSRLAVRRSWPAGRAVVRQGELGGSMYAVASGLLHASVQGADGREIVLRLLGPGDLFGELGVFDHKPRSASVVALQRSELLAFEREELLALMRRTPELSLKLLAGLAGLVRDLTARAEELSALPVHARLCKKLLELAAICGTPLSAQQVALPAALSQQRLASHIQATRESVNKNLGVLIRQGILQRTRVQLVILDRARLEALARGSALLADGEKEIA